MKISMEMLKMMSKCGIKTDDWQHLEMLEEYHSMRENCEKFRYIMAYLAEKYRFYIYLSLSNRRSWVTTNVPA